MTRHTENNGNVDDPVDYLLQKAKKEFFLGKVSQAAYLWEKALEKAPDNEEALACRAYVRKNSIALRAVALGKDLKVPPPPEFLKREDDPRGKTGGARRFSSTEDLEWSDLEDEPPQSQSISQGQEVGTRDTPTEGAESEADEDSVLLPSLPELAYDRQDDGREDVEKDGLEVGDDVGEGDYSKAAERQIVSQTEGEEADDRPGPSLSVGGGVEVIPKPSTTLSGMPTSRLLPKDLFNPDGVSFSDGGVSMSDVGLNEEKGGARSPGHVDVEGGGLKESEPELASMPGDDEVVSPSESDETIRGDGGEAQESHSVEDRDLEQSDSGQTDMSVLQDPEEHVVKMSDRESEALLDPEKGLVYARELFEAGEHAESLRICELLEDQLEGNEDIEDLIEQNREILEKLYIQRLGGLDSVPRVELGAGDLQNMDMDHKTAFLLTRIDGMLTIDDVMSIAGMSRLETAKMLMKALEKGIIVIE